MTKESNTVLNILNMQVMVFGYLLLLGWENDENKQKEAGIGQYFNKS